MTSSGFLRAAYSASTTPNTAIKPPPTTQVLRDSLRTPTASNAVTIGTRLKNPATRAEPSRCRPVIHANGAMIEAPIAANAMQPMAAPPWTPVPATRKRGSSRIVADMA
ncbi:hypothetical protein G6F52_014089 [Rhizopus delemar]|nr:hypothetical protein G6F52_014089 [Rhizopus delemar]